MARLLKSRCHFILSGRTVLLRITGRRTGREYEIGVGYSQPDDTTLDVLVSDASHRTWWRNYLDGGPVRIVHRGRERAGWAMAHRAPTPEFKQIADRAIVNIVGVNGAQRFFALASYDPEVGLRDDDLRLLEGFAVAVEIKFDDSGGSVDHG
jgi:hypothetical protein